MSEKNVELVRQSFATWHDVDTGLADPEQLRPFFAPDVVWEMGTFSGWPGQSEFRGPDEFFAFRESWYEAYDEWSYELEQLIDAGDKQVVATLSQQGKPRGSDAWVEMRYGIVYTLESGLIQRAQVYASPGDALRAAGLSE